MRAVGYQTPLSRENPASLQSIDQPNLPPSGRDRLVEIKAISINQVDIQVLRNATYETDQWRVLRWDAAGSVVAVGPDVTDFSSGDKRLVGRKRRSLHWTDAPALPIIGGAGGVCSTAIQLARTVTDLTVIATPSSFIASF